MSAGPQVRAFFRAEARRLLARNPRAYMALVSRTDRRSDCVTATTSVLVEGYPRSGNTFALALLRTAFPDLTFASHLHAAAHVKQALRLGVPALVLAREPLAAVASFSIREPQIPVSSMLRAYVDFYRCLAGVRESLMVVPFDVLVDDPGDVLRTVAARLGRHVVPEVDAPFLVRTRSLVEQLELEAAGGVLSERRVPLPSPARTERNAAIRATVAGEHARLLARCQQTYEVFTAPALDDHAPT